MADVTKVNVVEINTKDSQRSITDLKKRIKELKSEILNLTEGTEEWQDKMRELGDTQHEYVAIAQDAKYMSQDFGEILANTAGLAGSVTSAIGGLTAGLQLMGLESEKTQEATLKLFQLMSIAQSFTVLEDGVKRVKGLTLAIKTATKNVSKLKIALGSIGVGLAVGAITLLMTQLSKLTEKQNEYNDSFNDFKNSVASSTADFDILRMQYADLGDDMVRKQQFIENNANALDYLGIKLNNVNDGDSVFINNTDKVIAAIQARVNAEQIAEKLKEKKTAKNSIEIEANRDKSQDGFFKNIGRELGDDLAGIGQILGFNTKTSTQRTQDQLNGLNDEIATLEEESKTATEEFNKLIEELKLSAGGGGSKITEEVESLEDYLEVLKQINQEKLKSIAEPATGLKPFDAEADLEDKQGRIDDRRNDSDIQTLREKNAMMNELINASKKEKNDILKNWALEDLKIQESENQRQMEILELSHTYGLMSEGDYQRQKQELMLQGSQISVAIAEEEANQIKTKRESIASGMKMLYDQVPTMLTAIQGTLDTNSKKGFEQNKKLEKAQASLSYISSVDGAWRSVMSSGIPFPYNIPLAVGLIGMLTATFLANIKKIENLKFNGGGAGIGGSTPSMPSVSSGAVNSLQSPNIGNTRLTFTEGDIENLPTQKTYVLASEIEEKVNLRKTTVTNSTF